MNKRISKKIIKSLLIMLLSTIIFSVSLVFAATCSDNPPVLPNSFSGTVLVASTVGGTKSNASVGAVIRAYVDYASDTTADATFTVTSAGNYEIGVTGCSTDNGKTINFTVDSVNANVTSIFYSNGPAPRTVAMLAEGTVSSNGSSSSSGGGGGGGGGTISPVAAPAPAVPATPSIPSAPAESAPESSEAPAASEAGAATGEGDGASAATGEAEKSATEKGTAETGESELGKGAGTAIAEGLKKATEAVGDFAGMAFGIIGGGKTGGPLIVLIILIIIVVIVVFIKMRKKSGAEKESVLYKVDVQQRKSKKR
ncbi:hypothetical protein HZA96_04905 [Candidatus Woesearchaeota archaeon]|nr:hypothetical protein [Candidatus Woesearchaeota archaeon]